MQRVIDFLSALMTSVKTWRSHAMKVFDVKLRMSATMVSKVLSEYSDYFVGCDEVKDGSKQARQHYANGKRNKGISGRELILQSLGDHLPHGREELRKAMVEHGFAESSIHPQLSMMVKAQEIKRLGEDHYMLNTATSQAALNLPGHGVA